MSAEGDISDRQRKMERDVTIVSLSQYAVGHTYYTVVQHRLPAVSASLTFSAKFYSFTCTSPQVSIVICTAFILAWSPYAVVSMWSAFGFHVPNLTSIFTRLFAKSASFYNPLIYFGLSSKFRKDVAILLPCARSANDSVKLKRFKAKADARGRPPAAGGGARRKGRPKQSGKNYSPEPVQDREEEARSPPCMLQTVSTDKQVFFIEAPQASDVEFECERL